MGWVLGGGALLSLPGITAAAVTHVGAVPAEPCRLQLQHSRSTRPGGDEPWGADTHRRLDRHLRPKPQGAQPLLAPGPHCPAFPPRLTAPPRARGGLARCGRGAWCCGAGSLRCTSTDNSRQAGRWRGSRRRGSSENSLILYSGHQADYRGRHKRSRTDSAGQQRSAIHLADTPPDRTNHSCDTLGGARSVTLPLGPREKMRGLGGFGMLSLLLPGAASAPTR